MKKGFSAVRIFFTSAIVSFNVIAALLMIVSAYSDRISPETNVLFAYLGLFFPIICFINFIFILYWLFQLAWKQMLIGVIAFVICWVPVKNFFPMHMRSKDVPKENVLKVLTYNVMGFAYKNDSPDSPNGILQYIANSGADIVCMQEYAVSNSSKLLTANKVYRALKMYPYHSVIPIANAGMLNFGIAVFSKYPISGSHRIDYKSDFNGSAIHFINIKGKKVAVINNHLESFKLTTEDRSRYSAFFHDISSENFSVLKGTLRQKLGPAYRMRANQADKVAEEIDKIEADYVIVCGDFNDTPISYAHRKIQGPFADSFAESGRGMGVSYNRNMFWFRIDHILHSQNMKSYNCVVDKIRLSDHYPMWCYLEMK